MNIYLTYICIHTYITLVTEEEIINLRGSSSGRLWKEVGKGGKDLNTMLLYVTLKKKLK